jgi:hypothetical protein
LRWDILFDDLEAQAAALERAELAGEVDERTRGELATLSVADRLRAALGESIRVGCLGATSATGVLRRLGPDWLLVDEGSGREVFVLLGAVTTLRGLGRGSAVPGSMPVVERRLNARHMLRGIARDRLPVRLQLRDGAALDATVDRVGADFVEVAAHAAGEPRRREAVRQTEIVPFTAIAMLRRIA